MLAAGTIRLVGQHQAGDRSADAESVLVPCRDGKK